MRKLSARNLVVSTKKLKAIKKKSHDYKEGFFDGYATCKAQATHQGYHRDIAAAKTSQ